MSHYDAIVIGAGPQRPDHRRVPGARRHARVRARARDVVGGAAVTEEFHPGYRNSIFSYVVSLLRPEVVRDLELERFGYEPLLLENALYLDSRGDYLLLNGDEAHDRAAVRQVLGDGLRRLPQAFEASVEQVGDLLARQWLREPPKAGHEGSDDLVRACAWARTSTVWTRKPAGA
jgi:phytoene dehydrogenase-like protein